jgi:hypothetical protein
MNFYNLPHQSDIVAGDFLNRVAASLSILDVELEFRGEGR